MYIYGSRFMAHLALKVEDIMEASRSQKLGRRVRWDGLSPALQKGILES